MKWISVNDRLPEHMQEVAFVVSHDTLAVSAGRILGGRYSAEPSGGFEIPFLGGIPASHWMPLPPPPTAEDDAKETQK